MPPVIPKIIIAAVRFYTVNFTQKLEIITKKKIHTHTYTYIYIFVCVFKHDIYQYKN